MGLLVTNSLCWKRFERYSVGNYRDSALSWMFRRAKIAWDYLLRASTLRIIEQYNIRSGVLVIDDTDRERSKNTVQISKTHKIKNKKSGGYFNGQNIIFLILVSKELTIPVGFDFHQPDPALTAWRKSDRALRKKGVLKKYRPPEPDQNPAYPGKKELALKSLQAFSEAFPFIKIKAVIADLFYGSKAFMQEAQRITGKAQTISQIRKTQLIHVNGNIIQVGKFFKEYQGKTETIQLRYTDKQITYTGACFKVKSHDNQKYRIVALKYDNEEEYRYLIASDLTWLMSDVIKTFALRWLVEVFIQDWKSHEGWNQLAMQPGEDGSNRGVTLSLLCDHVLHFHQDQIALFEERAPAATVGSLRQKVILESLITFIENIINSDNPKKMFDEYTEKLSELFELRASIKHMRNSDVNV